jgi:hypothetical protein
MRVSGWATISFQWATKPTVRASAKTGVNIADGRPEARKLMPE